MTPSHSPSPDRPHTLGTIDSLIGKSGQTGTGTYLLTGYTEHVGHSGQPRLQLTLEDARGRVTGFVWPEARSAMTCTATPSPVSVRATVQIFEERAQLKVQGLAPLDLSHVPSATELLPRHRCPEIAHPALDRLTHLEHDLPAPLDGFLREVLLDPRISLPFMRCRASVNHHHAFVGGLLVHSTEMLDLAHEITHRIIPDDDWSSYLAQLGYLLHDLGKLRSVGELRRPRYGLVVPHEIMTIEMLTPPLRSLEQRAPDLAVALRHLFAHMATPHRVRTTPQHVIAEVVTRLDQWSAATHNRRDLKHLLDGNRKFLHQQTHRLRAVADSHRQPWTQNEG